MDKENAVGKEHDVKFKEEQEKIMLLPELPTIQRNGFYAYNNL